MKLSERSITKQAGSVDIEAIIDAIKGPLALSQSLQEVDETNAPITIARLLDGLNTTVVSHARIMAEYNRARIDRKEVEGRVALEDYPHSLGGVKGTEAMREAFVNRHPEVVAARYRESELEAATEYLSSCKMSLTMAVSAAKAIAYSHRASDMFSGKNYVEV